MNKEPILKNRLISVDERDELDDILVQAEKLAAKINQPIRPIGSIRKQNIR